MTTFTLWRADDGMVRIEDAEGGAIVLMPEEVPVLALALKLKAASPISRQRAAWTPERRAAQSRLARERGLGKYPRRAAAE